MGKLHLAHLTTAYGLEAKLISTASGCDPGKLNWMLVVKKSYFQNCAGLCADQAIFHSHQGPLLSTPSNACLDMASNFLVLVRLRRAAIVPPEVHDPVEANIIQAAPFRDSEAAAIDAHGVHVSHLKNVKESMKAIKTTESAHPTMLHVKFEE